MFQIHCPWCGERSETEFRYGGEAHIARPEKPEDLSDAEWGDFLFMRTNPKGWHRERWMHSAGCRRWFNAIRNTHTNEFHTTYKIGEKPALPGEEKA
jgi:sarcosine oxidase, subunit delta